MSTDNSGWENIPSLEGLEVDWEFEVENSMGKRAYSRLTLDELRNIYKHQDIPVKLVSQRGQSTAYLVDLSQGGISLRTKLSHSENSELVKLGFILGEYKIISRGRIKHIRKDKEWTMLGIEFVGLTGMNQEYIAQLYSSVKFKGGRP